MSDRPIIQQRDHEGSGFVHRLVVVSKTVMGLVAVLMSVSSNVSLGFANEFSGSAISAGMQSGMVTAVYAQTVKIDGREFGFSPKVVVLDSTGQKVELSYIVWNSEVQFRVMKDDIRRIDRIIVQQPE